MPRRCPAPGAAEQQSGRTLSFLSGWRWFHRTAASADGHALSSPSTQEIETPEGKRHSSRAPEQVNQTLGAPQNGVGARFVAD
jgi:hypothetical protein